MLHCMAIHFGKGAVDTDRNMKVERCGRGRGYTLCHASTPGHEQVHVHMYCTCIVSTIQRTPTQLVDLPAHVVDSCGAALSSQAERRQPVAVL